jgi:hypothetical protein
VHLGGAEAVRDAAAGYLRECAPGNGFALGILENLPVFGMETMATLAEAVLEMGNTG